jgi:PIN domain nuclease of toxin-antitoxin system
VYLLDTHTLLWWTEDDRRLPENVRRILSDRGNSIYFSAVSVWEVSIKAKLGKLTIPVEPLQFISKVMEAYEFVALPILFSHAAEVFNLPLIHADPFDRLLVAQARIEKLVLLSNDAEIEKYGVKLVW